MQRPLLRPALAFAAGIVAGDLSDTSPTLAAAAALVVLAVSPWLPRQAGALLAAGFFLAGAAAGGWDAAPLSPADLRRLVPVPPQLITLRGVIRESPEFRLPEPHGAPAGRTMVRLEAEAILVDGRWAPAAGGVMSSTPGALAPEYCRSTRVEVRGVLDRPPGAAAEGLFDYRTFLARQGVWWTLRTDGPEDWRRAAPGGATPPASERFMPWARAALARGLPDDEASRLFAAMALGWKTPLTEAVDDPYLRSGTLHVFAVSGLHIALLAWMIAQILQLARMPRNTAGLAALPFTWFYVAATGWQASALRAGVMSTVILAGAALRRPGDLLNSLSAAALLVLIWQPGQVFQAGFQLSFIAVAGIGWVGTPLRNRLRLWFADPNDPFLPRDLKHRPAWLDAGLGWLADNLALGAAALLATLPLTIHWFHVVSPVSLLANLAVVPLSAAALAAALASLLSAPLWPWLGEVFNAAGWVLLEGMTGASKACAALPGGHWFTPSPEWWWWLPYYGAMAIAGFGWVTTRRRRWIALTFGSAVVLAALATWGWRARTVSLTVLAEGEATLITGAGVGAVLIDAGDTNSANRLILPLLRARGVNHLDALVAARPDVRHASGAAAVLDGLPTHVVVAPAGGGRWPGGRLLTAALAARRVSPRLVAAGAAAPPWTVLAPGSEPASTADEGALALGATVQGIRVVSLGNLGRTAQRRLASADLNPTDVVIAGEPVDGEPWSEALWERLKPQLIVLTSARRPAARRLRPGQREPWQAHGVPVIFTADHGAARLCIRGGACRIVTMDGGTWSVTGRNQEPERR